MAPLFVLPFTLLVVWRTLSAAICSRYAVQATTHRGWRRAGAAGSRFARDDKELGPQLGKTITRRTAS
jgi:hypothetical protein